MVIDNSNNVIGNILSDGSVLSLTGKFIGDVLEGDI